MPESLWSSYLFDMEIDLVFKIAAVGIIVSILNQVLSRSGREEQATMTTLAGLIVVLMILAQEYPSVSRHAINASVWEINAGLNSSMLRTTENGWPPRVTKTIIQRSLNSPGLQTATSKWQWAGEKRI